MEPIGEDTVLLRGLQTQTIKITIGREIHANLRIELPSVEVDELLLFNKVLTAAEITTLSNVESYHWNLIVTFCPRLSCW